MNKMNWTENFEKFFDNAVKNFLYKEFKKIRN